MSINHSFRRERWAEVGSSNLRPFAAYQPSALPPRQAGSLLLSPCCCPWNYIGLLKCEVPRSYKGKFGGRKFILLVKSMFVSRPIVRGQHGSRPVSKGASQGQVQIVMTLVNHWLYGNRLQTMNGNNLNKQQTNKQTKTSADKENKLNRRITVQVQPTGDIPSFRCGDMHGHWLALDWIDSLYPYTINHNYVNGEGKRFRHHRVSRQKKRVSLFLTADWRDLWAILNGKIWKHVPDLTQNAAVLSTSSTKKCQYTPPTFCFSLGLFSNNALCSN